MKEDHPPLFGKRDRRAGCGELSPVRFGKGGMKKGHELILVPRQYPTSFAGRVTGDPHKGRPLPTRPYYPPERWGNGRTEQSLRSPSPLSRSTSCKEARTGYS